MNKYGRPIIIEGPKAMVTTTITKADKDRIHAVNKNQSEFIRDAITEKLQRDEAASKSTG